LNAGLPRNESASKAWLRAMEMTARLHGRPAVSLPALLDDLAAAHGARPALASPEEELSYEALAGRMNQYARWALDQGIQSGEVVCLLMENCPEYVAIWLGITRIGGIVALINTNLTGDGLVQAIAAASPRNVITGQAFAHVVSTVRSRLSGVMFWIARAHLPGAASRNEIDRAIYATGPLEGVERRTVDARSIALLIYTSGTTGWPKAVKVSHYRILEWSYWFAGLLNLQPSDRLYDCLPLYHSTGGVVGIGSSLVKGASVVIRRRFSATRFWDDIKQQRCTLFIYIGELCRYLLATTPPAQEIGQHQLRICFGNGLRGDVWQAFEQRFRIPRIIEFYASTEGNIAFYNCEGRPGAIGRVPPFLAHRFPVELIRCDPETGEPQLDGDGRCIRCGLNEIGEAVGKIISGDDAQSRAFEGYTDDAATERKILRNAFMDGDQWFRSGDLMCRDEAGFFRFVDRLGDTFRWKGENVSTTQVAEVLGTHPGVTQAVVYGVEIPGHEGRAGMGAIVMGSTFDPAQLYAHLEVCLPAYAQPVFIRLCLALEATGTFKPIKARLVQDGFGPAADADGVYVRDAVRKTFRKLDSDLRRRIEQGLYRI
jgi:fatty-acyl-CoA synthase